LNQWLIDYSNRGDEEIKRIEELLDDGANINSKNERGETPLICAALMGQRNAVRLLLDRGADVHEKNIDGHTALMESSMRGHLDIVRMLVERGARIDDRSLVGETALMLAAMMDATDEFMFLLDQGADIHAHDHRNTTSLMWAASSGNAEIVSALIDRGADLFAADTSMYRPIHYALMTMREYPEVIRILLDRGESTDGTMPDGRSFDEFCEKKPVILSVILAKRSELAVEGVLRNAGFSTEPGLTVSRPRGPAT
jgi:ankyrin repeat protein